MVTRAITEDFCAYLAGIITARVPFRREQIPSPPGCWVFLFPVDLPSPVMAFAVAGAKQGRGEGNNPEMLLLE